MTRSERFNEHAVKYAPTYNLVGFWVTLLALIAGAIYFFGVYAERVDVIKENVVELKTEMNALRTDMNTMRTDMNDRFTNLNNRIDGLYTLYPKRPTSTDH